MNCCGPGMHQWPCKRTFLREFDMKRRGKEQQVAHVIAPHAHEDDNTRVTSSSESRGEVEGWLYSVVAPPAIED